MRATIERDGLLADLEAIGATVLANACGPCIGQWDRDRHGSEHAATRSSTAYNRNFPKRNDGSANTLAFVTSPDTVIAYALAGTLDFNPLTDTITNDEGVAVKLDPPVGEVLPAKGFDPGESGFLAPPDRRCLRQVVVEPDSTRLQLLEPFPPWDGKDLIDMPVLMKAKGKCTTDHISAAGKWLTYRGHLENISRQPVPRRRQRVHRRDRRGQGSGRRRDTLVPRHREALRRVGRRVVRGGRRELRRGIVA